MISKELIEIFPVTAEVKKNYLHLGGCDVVELARQYGTPLYIFDEETLRKQCCEFTGRFTARYPDTAVVYACKAYINLALARIFQEEGLGLDVVSAGEMAIARAAGFPLNKAYFHGNNKGEEELNLALEWGIGRVVVDNFHELSLLQDIASRMKKKQDILLRLSPGVDPHTHHKTTTGILDSKFGFPIVTGQAEEAVKLALKQPNLNLIGLHSHLGSPIFEMEPYKEAIEIVLDFSARMKGKYNFNMKEFSPGGGYAIQYVRESPPPPVAAYADAISSALKEGCKKFGLSLPRMIIEPGRAIVGRAGVALYQVGARKDIPGLRTYISVDGGMADNIRVSLYGARYEALAANRAEDENTNVFTIAGKFCESGDILLRDVSFPALRPGDLLALPASGAYCLSMASNYNASLRPAVVIVKDGKAKLCRRRETYEDLYRCDTV